MKKIQLAFSKTIRLQNVLIYELNFEKEKNISICINQMRNYIMTKGMQQIGPLIQFTKTFIDNNSELDMEVYLMLQSSSYIHSVEKPYRMESLVRIQDCMYCRYVGPEEKLKYAYDKINIEAFENDIDLTGESYTVFVDSNEEDGTIIADVFMPKA